MQVKLFMAQMDENVPRYETPEAICYRLVHVCTRQWFWNELN